MNKIIIVSCILLGSFCACNTKKTDNLSDQEIFLSSLSTNESIRCDSVTIQLDAESLPVYNRGLTAYEENGAINVLIYNPSTRSLDIFDLSKKSIRHIPITNIEKFGLHEVYAIDRINSDTLFVYSYPSLFIVNGVGEILDKKDLRVEYNGKKGFLLGDIDSRPYYNSSTKEIYGLLRYDNDTDRFDSPIGIKLNIETGESKTLPILHQPEYKEKYEQLGYNKHFQISFYQNQAIFNYGYSSSFYIYDYNTEQTNTFTINDDKAESFRFVKEGSSPEELLEAYIQNPFYAQPVMYKEQIGILIWNKGEKSLANKTTSLEIASLKRGSVKTNLLPGSNYQISSVQSAGNKLIIQQFNREKEDVDSTITFMIAEF